MPHYSPERKEAILRKMAPPHSLAVAELASQKASAPVPCTIGAKSPENEVMFCRRNPPQREAPSQFLLWQSFDSKAALDVH